MAELIEHLNLTVKVFFHLDMDERMTLTNMAIEGGAMNGIIAADEITEDYVKSRGVYDV